MTLRGSAQRFMHMITAATPDTGQLALFAKNDNSLWVKKADGSEQTVGGLVGSLPLTTHVTALNAGWSGTVQYMKFGNMVTVIINLSKTSWVVNEQPTVTGLPVGIRPVTTVSPVGTGVNSTVNNAHRPWYVDSAGHVRMAVAGTDNAYGIVTYQVDAVERSTAMNSGAESGVTSGAKVNAASTQVYLRGGVVEVNVNATVGGTAMVAGDIAFTMPSGFLPPTTIFVTIDNANPDPPVAVRFHLLPNGGLQLQGSLGVAAGVILRGSFSYSAAISAAGLGSLVDTGWISHTPNWPNVPIGSVQYAKHRRVGNTMTMRGAFTLSAAINLAFVDLVYPLASGTPLGDTLIIGRVRGIRTGVAWYQGDICPAQNGPPSRGAVYMDTGSGNQWGVSTPAAWASGDRWGYEIEYEAAPL